MSQTVGFHDGMKRFLQEMQFSMKKKKISESKELNVPPRSLPEPKFAAVVTLPEQMRF